MDRGEEQLLNEIIRRLDNLTITDTVFILSPAASITLDEQQAIANAPTTPNALNPFVTLTDLLLIENGAVDSVIAGTNINVDDTDNENPIVSVLNDPTFSGVATFNAGIYVDGNISVTGTVDGRDVFNDGLLLDTAIQPNVEVNGALVLKSVITDIDTTYDLDWSLCNNFELTLINDTVISFTNLVNNQTLVVVIKQDGVGNRVLTLPVGIQWGDATIPTYSTGISEKDVFTFIRINGVVYGSMIPKFG